MVSPKFFHLVFVHLVCNSALVLASCCCSFLLHVANLISVFFSFSSTASFNSSKIPSFFFVAQKHVSRCFSENFHLDWCHSFLFFLSEGPNITSNKLKIFYIFSCGAAIQRGPGPPHSWGFYEGWNFNFGNTPLDWIQELLEWRANAAGRMGPSPTYVRNGSGPSRNGHTQ